MTVQGASTDDVSVGEMLLLQSPRDVTGASKPGSHISCCSASWKKNEDHHPWSYSSLDVLPSSLDSADSSTENCSFVAGLIALIRCVRL